MGNNNFRVSIPSIIFNRIFPLLTLASVSLTWSKPWVTLVLLLVISALTIYLHEKPRVALSIWLVALIAGPIAEIVAIHYGAWSYAKVSNDLPIPLWLAPCWGLAGIFFLKLSLIFDKSK